MAEEDEQNDFVTKFSDIMNGHTESDSGSVSSTNQLTNGHDR